jgi:hypothetical protein
MQYNDKEENTLTQLQHYVTGLKVNYVLQTAIKLRNSHDSK